MWRDRNNFYGMEMDVVIYNWQWAITQLAAGQKVCRPQWDKDLYLTLESGRLVFNRHNGTLYISMNDYRASDWKIHHIELRDIKIGEKYKLIINGKIYQRVSPPHTMERLFWHVEVETGKLDCTILDDRSNTERV